MNQEESMICLKYRREGFSVNKIGRKIDFMNKSRMRLSMVLILAKVIFYKH